MDVVTFDPNPRLPQPLAPNAHLLRLSAGFGAPWNDMAPLIAALTYHLRHNPIPDILHAHFAESADIARIVGAHYDIPVVYTPHRLATPDTPRRLAAELRAIRFAHSLIVATPEEAEVRIPALDPTAITRTHRISPDLCALSGRADWTRHATDSVAVYDTLLRPAPALHTYAQRLLVCDIDHLRSGCAPSLARWTAATPLVITTRQSLPEARAHLRRFALPAPAAIITNAGTQIFLDGPTGLHLWADHDARIAASWNPAAVQRLASTLRPEGPARPDHPPHTIRTPGGPDLARRLAEALRKADIAARILPSRHGWIDLLPPAAGKTNALAAVAARFGLTLADCIAAVDGARDAELANPCGAAVVVSNLDRPSHPQPLPSRLQSFA
ncbi:HAD family hydrolase [Falsirhodobacter sp. 20TX0035]|uniref:HAD family hydrolase n=1 Tax=Falsirhodobacter sp. 20TX0035 TaxID=3022019 RepID=UPI00232C76E3|nr:HAD family hydrolase [Falsirhodobacter sp. 20TX0035]MDB6452876.1 HAD family hydrolase [Falsirhodobacter sp. 20TX0035]